MRNLVVEWLLGAICLFLGSVYLLNVNPSVLGATDFSVSVSYAIAFVFYLVTGYLWVGLVPETISMFSRGGNGAEERPTSGEEVPSKPAFIKPGELANCGTPEGC